MIETEAESLREIWKALSRLGASNVALPSEIVDRSRQLQPLPLVPGPQLSVFTPS